MTRGAAVSLNNHLSPTSSPPPSPPPPPEVSGDPPKNPWRINHAGGCATAVSVTLAGEPSSDWPPLSSQHQRPMKGQSNSPPPPPPPAPEPPTVIHQSVAVKTEEPIAGDLTPSPSSSSPDHASGEETSIPTTELPAAAVMETPVSPPPPPPPPLAPPPQLAPAPPLAPVPPPFSGNAAATAAPPRSPRHPAPPPARRGRGQRFNHHRGSSSSGYRNHNGAQNNRAPNPGWRPNWSLNSPPPPPPPPQHSNWGFYPGTVPPGDANSYFVPYIQGYNDMVVYQDYVMDPYGNYYDYSSYEMPYPTPLSPVVSDPVTLQVAPSFSTVATLDHGVGVKDALLAQIEYYFSDINLHKDAYLKSLMDSEGWVDIHEIAKFRKVKAQTEKLSLIEDDCINFIKDALQSSKVLELQGDKIRRHEWHQWISQQSSQNPLVVSMQSIRLAD